MMKTMQFSNANRDWGFVASEAPGRMSREQTTLAGPRAADTLPGTVLGRSPRGASTVTAAAAISGSGGTPGNGAVNALTADANAEPGVYQIRILEPVANGGRFEVLRPGGEIDGNGSVGVAYNGAINFTLADGSVDFVEDDRIPITVAFAQPTGAQAALNLAGVGGDQIADSILGMRQPKGTGAKRCAVLARQAEVVDNLLIWPAGITQDQKAAAIAQLALKGIIVRPNV